MTPLKAELLNLLIMYFLTIFSLIVIQSLLEISIPAHIVNIGIFIYCFIAYYLVQNFVDAPIWKMILFPSLMFGMQNECCVGREHLLRIPVIHSCVKCFVHFHSEFEI